MTKSPFTVRPPRGATPRQQPTRIPHLRWVALGLIGVTTLAFGLSGDKREPTIDASVAETLPVAETVAETMATELETALVESSADAPSPEAIAPAPEPVPAWHEEVVRSGDNLSLIFNRAGFSDRDVYEVTQADGGRALRKIFPGEKIAFLTDDSGALSAVRHTESPLKATTFMRGEAGFATEILERAPDVRVREASMTIDSSLFMAGQDAGLSGAVIMELASIFGGVIDFVLDPRAGDAIHVVYEQLFVDGEKLKDGNIVAASFTNQGKTFQAYRYTDSQGDTSYYNELGVSMRKAFLKAPLDFTRVSSNFNPNRLHPIYKTKRPHRGTDYAAPRGTPVYAAGDGRVIEAGYTRANGNYVFIQHGEGFRTHYLHLNKRRTSKGARVKQGEVIGTVGSTGAATGPHLHYEFLVNGVHRNPRTVHKLLPKAKSLPKTEIAQFRRAIREPLQQLAALRGDTRLAMAE
ncbi:MAG: peptidoglycan DD-metalloendopeptidase family protein [Halieaceae bacterium]|jgi:murein DD-endopeptidase MepM/ murein hydrolase activator NlpD|nr:peptidoglycan DD-metalloendopeptidase family protein [Halieaceae bacterium]